MSDDRSKADHLREWLVEGEGEAHTADPLSSVQGAPAGVGALFDTLQSAGAPSAWLPETRVGRYLIVRAVGEGGMGAVYEAQDTKLKRRVAIKRLHPMQGHQAQQARERLLREAQALAQVSHPAVVHVYDCDLLGDAIYLVMEFVEGEPLRSWLRRPRELAEIVDVFKGIGAGLGAAHGVGLVHRDFKPDNVMIDRLGRPRVLDFGLACAVSDYASVHTAPAERPQYPGMTAGGGNHPSLVDARLTAAGLLVGTPPYMAPEQILGKQAGPHSDQFSFCVSLFEAVCGRRPFDGTDKGTVFEQIVHHAISFPPEAHVPNELQRLLSIGLAKRPEQRFTNMHHLLVTLDSCPVGGAAVVAQAVEPALSSPVAAALQVQPAVHFSVPEEPVLSTNRPIALPEVAAPVLGDGGRKKGRGPWIAMGLAAAVLVAAGIAIGSTLTSSGSHSQAAKATSDTPRDGKSKKKKRDGKKKRAADASSAAPEDAPAPAPPEDAAPLAPSSAPQPSATPPGGRPPLPTPPSGPPAPSPTPTTPPAAPTSDACNRASDCPGPNAACVVGKCKSCPAGTLYVMGGCRSQCTTRAQCGTAGEWDCYRPSLSLPNAYCVPLPKKK